MLFHKTKQTHEDRILKALHDAGHHGLWTHELARQSIGGHKFSAYISDLRKDGYNISRIRMSNFESKYFLEEN